jgi:glycosyltransferase involved in cell wall biosynthesis
MNGKFITLNIIIRVRLHQKTKTYSFMHPKITVIITTYNRSNIIDECLESILAQTLKPFQIIVINDGSTDSTRDALKPFLTSIEYIYTNHIGRSAAMNVGIDRAKGDYIWIFDDDDIAVPDALERLVKPLEEKPECGFSYSTYYYAQARRSKKESDHVIFTSKIPDFSKDGIFLTLLKSNFLGTPTILVRKKCYEDIGYYDTSMIRSSDYEMAIRLVRHYSGVQAEGGPTFYYRQHQIFETKGDQLNHEKIKLEQWLFYNQIIFHRVYKELPLEEYLPPGEDLEKHHRKALLQRIEIMSRKCLRDEVVQDIRLLAELSDHTPLSPQEYTILRNIFTELPHCGKGTPLDHTPIIDTVRRLCAQSQSMQILRGKISRALVGGYRDRPSFPSAVKTIQTLSRLYVY